MPELARIFVSVKRLKYGDFVLKWTKSQIYSLFLVKTRIQTTSKGMKLN